MLKLFWPLLVVNLRISDLIWQGAAYFVQNNTTIALPGDTRRTSKLPCRMPVTHFWRQIESLETHNVSCLQSDMVLRILNPFSSIFNVISSEKQLPHFNALKRKAILACWILIGQFKFQPACCKLQSRPKVVGTLELYHVFPIPPNNQCWKISRFFYQKGKKNHLIINIESGGSGERACISRPLAVAWYPAPRGVHLVAFSITFGFMAKKVIQVRTSHSDNYCIRTYAQIVWNSLSIIFQRNFRAKSFQNQPG